MNIIKNIKAALTYANYDLYKIKSEIANLILRGRKEGLGNPDYCKVTIKNSSIKRDYPIYIDLYYKTDKNEIMRLPQELLIGKFVSIKSSILDKLERDGYVEIAIKNLTELLISEKEAVEASISFNSVTHFTSKEECVEKCVIIKDEIFTYRVIYKYRTRASEMKSSSIVYADINEIPGDVLDRLNTHGEVSLILE